MTNVWEKEHPVPAPEALNEGSGEFSIASASLLAKEFMYPFSTDSHAGIAEFLVALWSYAPWPEDQRFERGRRILGDWYIQNFLVGDCDPPLTPDARRQLFEALLCAFEGFRTLRIPAADAAALIELHLPHLPSRLGQNSNEYRASE